MLSRTELLELVESRCPFKTDTHACSQYARYVVSPETPNKIDLPVVTCGQHLPVYVRRMHHQIADGVSVQVIPGHWKRMRVD